MNEGVRYMNGAGRVVGYDSSLIWNLVCQIISTAILIVLAVFIIRLCTLGIKALKIYIKKNK